MSPHVLDISPADLLQLGAARCAQAVASGQVTALALCEAAIATIESADGAINAVVVRDFDRARVQARAADERLARGEQPPLLGVPMTVKESFNVAGLPTTWGLPPFQNYQPQADAVVVQRLKAAGAVILGKTNVPSMLMDWQSVNPVYGRTMHPLDASRTPGGSSGGGAAALSAGMVALEYGSDLLGSIRIPAHFCGVWGHKSSAGIVPMRGHSFPTMQDPIGPMPDMPAVVGPLGRCAEDLRLALLATVGAESPMSDGWRLHLPEPKDMQPERWEVLLLDSHPLAAMGHEMQAALQEAAGRLARKGVRITRVQQLSPGELPDLAVLHQTYIAYVQTMLAAFEPGAACAMNAHEWIRLNGQRAALRSQCLVLMQRFDAVLSPTFGVPAFAHDDAPDWARRSLMIDDHATPYTAQGAWSSLAALAGLPATQVPITVDAQGMPMGVQLIGGWLQDLKTLEIARQMAD